MDKTWSVCLVGGDRRQRYLAQLLREDGHQVSTWGLEKGEVGRAGAETAAVVILPLPVEGEKGWLNAPFAEEKIPLEQVTKGFHPGQLVLGGRVPPELAAGRVPVLDYFAREELAVANAVPTAEGALQIALRELPETIRDSRVLILGYGRLGRALAPMLVGLGAAVTVAERRHDNRAWAESVGCQTRDISDLNGGLEQFSLVVNTVPARVLGRNELRQLHQNCLVIDLASQPGGTDFAEAERLGIQTVHALSLPGRTAPLSAARCLQKTIYHMVRGA